MSDTLRQEIFQRIRQLTGKPDLAVADDTRLLGDGSVLDSMKLVELCLLLEDLAETRNFSFDWTSENAMSKSRSIFRTAGALADEFQRQAQAAA